MNNNSNNVITGAVIAVLVFSGASFYGGMKYERSKVSASAASAQNRFSRFGQGSTTGARTFARNQAPVIGSLLSKDSTSLTVKLASGGSQIAFYDASTTVMKTSPIAVSELNAGDPVMVIGTRNPDGSVSAQSVQVGNEINRFRTVPQQNGGAVPTAQ